MPAKEVVPAALDIARDIAVNTAPLSVAVTKQLLWESPNLTPAKVGSMETELHHHLMGKPDAIEGVVAWPMTGRIGLPEIPMKLISAIFLPTVQRH